MWWRLSRAEWSRGKGGNRKAFRELVRDGTETGILAYADGEPVGWCALAPRGQYPRLFIARKFRRQELSTKLLNAAVDFARARGAMIVEGYPHETRNATPDVFVYTGLVSAFRKAGFKEVARRSETRPMMRIAWELQ